MILWLKTETKCDESKVIISESLILQLSVKLQWTSAICKDVEFNYIWIKTVE